MSPAGTASTSTSTKPRVAVNFLIGKDGKILEEQIDKDAIDPKRS